MKRIARIVWNSIWLLPKIAAFAMIIAFAAIGEVHIEVAFDVSTLDLWIP